MNNMDTIFSNGDWAVHVNTVEELIAELQRLPGDMRVSGDLLSGYGADLVLYNRHAELQMPAHVEMEGSYQEIDEETGLRYV